jgi:long-chain acyl-CoA synthetase
MQVEKNPRGDFLGTRRKNDDGSFGPYEWQSYEQIYDKVKAIARSMYKFNLCPDVAGETEGSTMRFTGIWAKNCEEWNVTQLASMFLKSCNVGFFDAMNDSNVDYIFNQTEMGTVFCSRPKLLKIIEMKQNGMAGPIKTIVLFDVSA